MKYFQYLGILIGSVYGFLYRLLCDSDVGNVYEYYNLYSITFIWITPIVISLIPILIANKEIIKNKWKAFLFPFLSVLIFFLISYSTGLEDFVCVIILSFPFIIIAGFVGWFSSVVIENKISKKTYSVILIPLLLNPMESLIPNNKENYEVRESITINKKADIVWKNIIEVPEIEEDEYENGFFNYVGIPRPIKSELKTINNIEYRLGYFSENLILRETIADSLTNSFIAFDIDIKNSSLRNTPTDQHILKSNYFKFNKISYKLNKITENKTELILSCKYSIDSKMNSYANFWAELIIADFEKRLLKAIKNKLEKNNANIKI